MPPDTPNDDGLSSHNTGWLLSRLRSIRPDRKLAGDIIREIASRHGEDGMSVNEIADAANIPRSTAHRWASQAKETETP